MIAGASIERAESPYDELQDCWDLILPDGVRYCHWGGKRITSRLLKRLCLDSADCVLDVCCGRGGSIPFLDAVHFALGVDISMDAVRSANSWKGSPSRLCIQADAHQMPFKDNFFQKVFSQDGDAWLHPAKHCLMAEIHRVTAPKGLFAYQSYVDTRDMPKAVSAKTRALFKKCGFTHAAVVHIEDVTQMFETAGFQIESTQSLHTLYARDNHRMLTNFEKRLPELSRGQLAQQLSILFELLQWEQMLFSKRWWTGVLVVARKM